jgi:hypothetical protein
LSALSRSSNSGSGDLREEVDQIVELVRMSCFLFRALR